MCHCRTIHGFRSTGTKCSKRIRVLLDLLQVQHHHDCCFSLQTDKGAEDLTSVITSLCKLSSERHTCGSTKMNKKCKSTVVEPESIHEQTFPPDCSDKRIALHVLMEYDLFDTEMVLPDIKRLVRYYGADPNLQDSRGRTALHVLMDKVGQYHAEYIVPLLDKLVEHGALLNLQDNSGWTIMHTLLDKVVRCRTEQFVRVLEKLLTHDADLNLPDCLGRTPLHVVLEKAGLCRTKHILPVIDMLVEHGAQLNLQDGMGRTALHVIMEKVGQSHFDYILPVLDKILERGATMDCHDSLGRTALHTLMAKLGTVDRGMILSVLDKLVEHGTSLAVQDMWGRTAVHLIVERVSPHPSTSILLFLDKLIEHGTQLNRQDNSGRTALHVLMTKLGSTVKSNVILPVLDKLILQAGTKKVLQDSSGRLSSPIVNLQNNSGRTTLHVLVDMVDSTNVETIMAVLESLLKKYHADPNIRDIQGQTALHHLVRKRNIQGYPIKSQIYTLLEEYGANVTTLLDYDGNLPLHYLGDPDTFDPSTVFLFLHRLELFT